MVSSKATTVEDYLAELPDDRRDAIAEVRDVVLDNLPDGYVESMNWGMISYEVPLETFPDTYNGKPLGYAALASQKNYMAIYLNNVYGDANIEDWFRTQYEATGKKLDMGKSCVRFKTLDQLPLDLIGEVIAMTPVDEFLERYRQARG
ncbi:MAG: DUF1801 domain-containing protein [Acidimicrobiia bacterium]|nr:DUF1801 domain-containing protein [Acidimicrobiia bacterium]